jgi:hypothetical protein
MSFTLPSGRSGHIGGDTSDRAPYPSDLDHGLLSAGHSGRGGFCTAVIGRAAERAVVDAAVPEGVSRPA